MGRIGRVRKFWKEVTQERDKYLQEKLDLTREHKICASAISSITTLKLMKENTDIIWSHIDFSSSPNISIQEILTRPSLLPGKNTWWWAMVAKRPDLTLSLIRKNRSRVTWFLNALSHNPNMTWDFVCNANLGRASGFWSIGSLSCNSHITLKIVKDNPKPFTIFSMGWSFYRLSGNPNLTFSYVKRHRGRDWNWYIVTKHPNITWNNIKDNPGMKWDYDSLPLNPNVTWKILMKEFIPHLKELRLYEDWIWEIEFSKHPKLTNQFIINHPRGPSPMGWNWEHLSENPGITWELVEKFPEKNWCYYKLSFNLGIPLEFALDRPLANGGGDDDGWVWSAFIGPRRYAKFIDKIIEEKARRHIAAYLIQEWWKNICVDKNHPIGAKRIKLDIEFFGTRD